MKKRIRNVETDVRQLKDGSIVSREDVHGIRGDMLRQEKAIASVEADIDRIKMRLDLRN